MSVSLLFRLLLDVLFLPLAQERLSQKADSPRGHSKGLLPHEPWGARVEDSWSATDGAVWCILLRRADVVLTQCAMPFRAEANVGGAAYTQGPYYKELEVGLMAAREYKLPTEAYVAPPVYVRRTGNYEKRIYDPIRQMARRAYACSTCFAS